ncbi:hypothetical protein TAMA11512_16870 [Selenomonas sp. TAMA-11512]|uniref:response regulator transcription factor n=1 Tax=Selenomonas sp. TAMA-11512 TaxID=3095337 RepID=UPI0030876F8B|nr:hypothetical protein TAMA11512_16870 [Selenomonas sp. TAMA-11512]
MFNIFSGVSTSFKNCIDTIRHAYGSRNDSLQGRFAQYIALLVGGILSIAALLLALTGFLNPLDRSLTTFMDQHLDARHTEHKRFYDRLAAHGIMFAAEIAKNTERTLRLHNASMQDLNNNPELLIAVEAANFPLLESTVQQNACSGAFYLLNATINPISTPNYRTGLYVKYIHLHSENTLMNELTLFRGDYSIARAHDINLSTTWQPEMNIDNLPEIQKLLTSSKEKYPKERVEITSPHFLVDTDDYARHLILPIYDQSGELIGCCGYEINSAYYQVREPVTKYDGITLISGVITQLDDGTYEGQFTNEAAVGKSPLTAVEDGDYTLLKSETNTFVARMRPILIGEKPLFLVTMIPEDTYHDLSASMRLKLALILAVLLLIFVTGHRFFIKTYLKPLAKHLRDLRKERAEALARYKRTATRLKDINREQETLQDRYKELKFEIIRRERELALLQEEKNAAEKQFEYARSTLENISKKKWLCIDEKLYRFFLDNLSDLTPKERAVFDAYADGLSSKEVMDALGITENTIKFHNKNIYSKLGVKSKKELLLYIDYRKNHDKS